MTKCPAELQRRCGKSDDYSFDRKQISAENKAFVSYQFRGACKCVTYAVASYKRIRHSSLKLEQ